MKKGDKNKKQDVNSDLTEIVCIIDKSGSMYSIKADAIGGFNSFLQKQKELPGEARLTLILFDDQYEIVHDSVPIEDVEELNEYTFVPRGNTALFDAIGRAIADTKAKVSRNSKKPGVMFCILTDGQENASREFRNKSQIADMIGGHREKDKWEFIYLAANQDAISEGASLGIGGNLSYTFTANAYDTTRSMRLMNYSVGSYRSKGAGSLDCVQLSSLTDDDLDTYEKNISTTTSTSK